ncbi:MAG TPA: PLP-dependent aminotransferase family protein, partial [Solirubrobacterales bacterium]|nr:PLP-dependent aminotransferase family protein [Solirubrobacterales bacterium]
MPDTISFARGAPSPDLIPVEAVRVAAAKALEDDWQKALSYGVGIGHPGLCAWIADRHGIDPSQVMTTNGSLEAGAMLFRHLLSPGDRVVVEQPSYDRTLLLLEQIGVVFVPIALEEDGIDVDALEKALELGPIKLAHIIPNFHNPAGCTLSEEKRRRLVALAAEHDF